MLRNFWNDDCGFIVSAELVLVATILVLGLIVGLVQVQAAIISELADVACAFGSLNQSYTLFGTSVSKNGHVISTGGSSFRDQQDDCDNCQCSSFFCALITGEATHP